MPRSALLCALLGALLVALPAELCAQQPPRPNTLTAYASVGYVQNVSTFPVEPQGLERSGGSGSVRLMWQPGYLLAAGIEGGYTHVYSVRKTLSGGEYHQTLGAWPILFVFSMAPVQRLHINLGTGPAISTGSASYAGSTVSSSVLGASYMASAMYLAPISPKFSLGAELRFLRLAKYEDNNLSLQITLARTMRSK